MNGKNNPLVSILMTVYNREAYLADAIESVIASSYSNWELIIVDDVSSDNSLKIARAFEEKDNRINVYVNENNLGDYPNRNKAASYGKGKYIKYIDADDMIYPYGLEQLVFYMEQFPGAGYGLCSLDQDKFRIYPFELDSRNAYYRNYFEQPLFHKAPLSSIIRRTAFNKVGGFANVRHYGDFEFWHRISQAFPVVLMPAGIVWYRFTEGQEASVRKKNALNQVKTLNVSRFYTGHPKSPLNEDEKTFMKRKHRNFFLGFIFKHSKKGDFSLLKDAFTIYNKMKF